MSEQRAEPGSRRPRPLAELGFDGVLAQAGELSRRWAAALILEGPPELADTVALADLMGEAPGLIGALVASLGSDHELRTLLAGGRTGISAAARIPALSGAAAPAPLVAAVEALRGVLWEALADEFAIPADAVRARQLNDLADRLAHVCSAILPAALEGIATIAAELPTSEARPSAPPGSHARAGAVAPAVRSGAVIVDERAAEPSASESRPLARPAAVAPSAPPVAPLVAEPSLGAEIEIRDERGDEGPAAWIRSIGLQLERFEQEAVSFAVLLVELRGEGGGSWERVEEILVRELRAGAAGTMTRERAGRYWLLSPATDRLGASALAVQITFALEAFVRARRLQLSVAVGTAVCPEDGTRASALAAHADVGLYAARSDQGPAPAA
jgi:hypothetical protein